MYLVLILFGRCEFMLSNSSHMCTAFWMAGYVTCIQKHKCSSR